MSKIYDQSSAITEKSYDRSSAVSCDIKSVVNSDLFCLLPRWKKSDVLALSPLRWRETTEQEHTQKLLADNPIRTITLD